MIVLGKYREIYHDDNLPSIKDCIHNAEYAEKSKVLEHLKNGIIGASAAGTAKDVISGGYIPGELFCSNDGKYAWRSDLIYYVDKYNLKLDDDFIEHCMTN